jgi:hypothetical protein
MSRQPPVTISAIPAEHLDRVRNMSQVLSGPSPEHLSAEGGEPLRCCLRDARPGERIMLFSYRPPLPAASVYQEMGAVYAHSTGCAGPGQVIYPTDWKDRPQVLRAYTLEGRIHPASRAHDGQNPLAAIEAILEHDDVVEVHSRNVVYGCYMFTARRSAGD